MIDDLDGRAGVAAVCALASLLVPVAPGAGIFFGLLGVILAGSSVLSVDGPPTTSTRRVAAIAAVVSLAAFALGLWLAAGIPQS